MLEIPLFVVGSALIFFVSGVDKSPPEEHFALVVSTILFVSTFTCLCYHVSIPRDLEYYPIIFEFYHPLVVE